MKSTVIIAMAFTALNIASTASADEGTREVLRCTGTLLGAPTYSLELVDPAEGPFFYRLIKQPNNPLFGPYTTEVEYGDVIRYGDAFILSQNEGRSGYALIYSRGETTIIDVNLFQHPEISSDGPMTNYQCETH